MSLNGFGLGLALPGPAAEAHGINPVAEGHRACLTLWTDDAAAAHRAALEAGAREHRSPHPFAGLQVAFVEDLDGHPLQFVERAGPVESPAESMAEPPAESKQQ